MMPPFLPLGNITILLSLSIFLSLPPFLPLFLRLSCTFLWLSLRLYVTASHDIQGEQTRVHKQRERGSILKRFVEIHVRIAEKIKIFGFLFDFFFFRFSTNTFKVIVYGNLGSVVFQSKMEKWLQFLSLTSASRNLGWRTPSSDLSLRLFIFESPGYEASTLKLFILL